MLDFVSDKRGTILKAAFDVFVTYGFRKTSMDDIARAAQMSRPALYQVFRNKTDIFRALSDEMMRHSAAQSEAALSGTGTFRTRLLEAIDQGFLTMVRIVDATPHGSELIGVNREIAFDIEEKWKAVFHEVFQAAMQKAADTGEVEFRSTDAGETASILMHGLEGIKQDLMRGEKVEKSVVSFVSFIADAVENRKAGA